MRIKISRYDDQGKEYATTVYDCGWYTVEHVDAKDGLLHAIQINGVQGVRPPGPIRVEILPGDRADLWEQNENGRTVDSRQFNRD